ncbi:hypothetical protein J6E39_08235 [bacterium]|nr:hypothetical protein [bacterium]
MKIQNISYSTNNYSGKTNQSQKNPTFGKLIVDEDIPFDILQAVVKNEELKKLVKMFHGINKDIEVSYHIPWDSGNTIDSLHFIPDDMLDSVVLFSETKELNSKPIIQQIENLKNGFAEKVFNKYLIKNSERENDVIKKQNILKCVDEFNNSLENQKENIKPKQSFWKKLFGN